MIHLILLLHYLSVVLFCTVPSLKQALHLFNSKLDVHAPIHRETIANSKQQQQQTLRLSALLTLLFV
jgi:hypothetical protein